MSLRSHRVPELKTITSLKKKKRERDAEISQKQNSNFTNPTIMSVAVKQYLFDVSKVEEKLTNAILTTHKSISCQNLWDENKQYVKRNI